MDRRYEGLHCTLILRRLAPRVVLIVIEGAGGGELGDRPFRALAEELRTVDGRFAVFIDARGAQGASLDIASRWAAWLAAHKSRFAQLNILARSRYVQLTAETLRRFAAFGELLRVYTDAMAFHIALADAVEAQMIDQDAVPTPPPAVCDDAPEFHRRATVVVSRTTLRSTIDRRNAPTVELPQVTAPDDDVAPADS